MMHLVYLALGTNIGDREKNMWDAIALINNRIGTIVSQSDFIVTEPEGFVSENVFLNGVVALKTEMKAQEVLKVTQEIEREMGRTQKSVNGIHFDRIIDIDILLYDQETIRTKELTIPHPRMTKRAFVLIPLAQIAPELVIPGESVAVKPLLDYIS